MKKLSRPKLLALVLLPESLLVFAFLLLLTRSTEGPHLREARALARQVEALESPRTEAELLAVLPEGAEILETGGLVILVCGQEKNTDWGILRTREQSDIPQGLFTNAAGMPAGWMYFEGMPTENEQSTDGSA